MKFAEFKVKSAEVYGGIQHVFKFENGYGASVVCHKSSYGGQQGLWEVAPWDETETFIGQSLLNWYDDVEGYLDWENVEITLQGIKNL